MYCYRQQEEKHKMLSKLLVTDTDNEAEKMKLLQTNNNEETKLSRSFENCLRNNILLKFHFSQVH